MGWRKRVHGASWDEFIDRCENSAWKLRLPTGIMIAIENLKIGDCLTVYQHWEFRH